MTIEIREGMPLDEYIERIHKEQFEILEGRVIHMSPTIARHDRMSKLFFRLLLPFEDQGLGEAFHESAFVLMDKFNWVRGSRQPDVMFVLAETLNAYREIIVDFDDKPHVFVPELVIEVISPNDNAGDVEAKVELYLADGVKIVWVVYPTSKKVHVYTHGSSTIQVLTVADTLNGGDVLPELSIPLKQIFV